uniref:Carbonic anhydrase n=1 Tax=Hemiselmis tepida TaxID=464990 RepID=A0A7S0VPA0_9CRYP|mmetsp:Transcript_22962/g.58022  ORF Transcript_22962/g.58022 Transcript_22962/m.58022 type:complete len:344 (+) Transcript_22962:16-1047(+)
MHLTSVAKGAALLAGLMACMPEGADAFAASPASLARLGGRAPAVNFASAAQKGGRAPLTGLKMSLSKDDKLGPFLESEKNLDHVFRNNKMWVVEQTRNDPDFFLRMSTGQSPKFLWIGCSDARVPANEIVGCGPGELFVHRNIANLVVNNDNSIQSVFQYAVEYLQVEHIIVCGHYQCGGVAASLNNADLASPLEEWVCNIRDVYRLHKEELDAIKSPEQRKRRLVELNAREQAVNVYKAAVVQRRRVYTHMKTGLAQPKVHAVVFDPKTGNLKRINTFEGDEQIDELHEVYDLYDAQTAAEFWENEEEYPKRENTPRKLFNRMPTGLSAAKQSVSLPSSDDE